MTASRILVNVWRNQDWLIDSLTAPLLCDVICPFTTREGQHSAVSESRGVWERLTWEADRTWVEAVTGHTRSWDKDFARVKFHSPYRVQGLLLQAHMLAGDLPVSGYKRGVITPQRKSHSNDDALVKAFPHLRLQWQFYKFRSRRTIGIRHRAVWEKAALVCSWVIRYFDVKPLVPTPGKEKIITLVIHVSGVSGLWVHSHSG